MENPPLNGRSFQTLILLTPGVVASVTSFSDQGQFSVNGQHADANYFTVDGVSANFGVTGYAPLVQTAGGALPALGAAGGTNSLVSVDAMQEFRIQTSSFAPEYGRTPGGQISIVTRSGTNQFHGTLFEYFRNGPLDARDWFVNFNGLPKPAERQNDFGGFLGGPVRKDRTFFFFSYEGLRLRQPATQQSAVPDAASREQAPAAMLPYLSAFPAANGSELGGGFAQFNAGYSNPSSLDAVSLRLDHAVNSKVTLFVRYNCSPSSLAQRAPALLGPVLSMTESLASTVQTFTTGATQILTPGISNEARANYSNQRVATSYAIDHAGGAVPVPDSALFPYVRNRCILVLHPGSGRVQPGEVWDRRAAADQRSGQSGGDEGRSPNEIRRGLPLAHAFQQPVRVPAIRAVHGKGGRRRAARFREPLRLPPRSHMKTTHCWYGTSPIMPRTPGKSLHDSPLPTACDGMSIRH